MKKNHYQFDGDEDYDDHDDDRQNRDAREPDTHKTENLHTHTRISTYTIKYHVPVVVRV